MLSMMSNGFSPQKNALQAPNYTVNMLASIGGIGSLICIDSQGLSGHAFNTKGVILSFIEYPSGFYYFFVCRLWLY